MRIVSLFYDYIDINGVNVIKDWIYGLEPGAKAKLKARLNALEQLNRTEWSMPTTEVLKGDKDGLIAVRAKYNRIQYRLLGYDGPYRGEFTLLACGTEKNNKYIPLDIGRKAFERREAVEENPIARRRRHDFG
jgi:hypothetical protein